jgi:glucose/arabinose dehydrogenase
MAEQRRGGWGRGPELHSLLAYGGRPLYPLLRRVTIRREGRRTHEPSDILLPDGYVAELVATGFKTPVHCTFGPDGRCYVTEAGFKIESRPRIVRVDVETGETDIFFELPGERWIQTGAMTGACWHDGSLYVTNTDTLFRIDADGHAEDVLTGLPGRGDHQTNHPVLGPDVPYGTATEPGQMIKGQTKCTGAVLRCNADGSALELVAWGLRNPFGLAFDPTGRLFATEHGIDERGHRHIFGDLEDLYEIREGAWYGWPDFASGIRLDDPHWGRRGRGREPVLAEHPDPSPPKPFVSFEPHAAPNGLAFSSDAAFGFEGDAFVALFGDLNPNTTRQATPAGFRIARVDMRRGEVVDFAVNKIVGPASKLPHGGFERPSHCEFGPDGALYVVDWGEIKIAPEAGGVRMKEGTGTLWRIRRVPGARVSVRPPEPRTVPLYVFLFYIPLLLILAAAGIGIRALGRWLR